MGLIINDIEEYINYLGLGVMWLGLNGLTYKLWGALDKDKLVPYYIEGVVLVKKQKRNI